MTSAQISIPTLHSERLTLRAFEERDVEPMAEFYRNDATARFVGGTETRQQVWRRIASYIGHWALRGYGMFAVEESSSKRFVGYTGNWFPDGWPEPEIAYGLTLSGQGKGYATEAAARALRYAYETLGWTTAISAVDPANTQSRHVAERLGATFEAHKPVAFFSADIYRHQSPEQFLRLT